MYESRLLLLVSRPAGDWEALVLVSRGSREYVVRVRSDGPIACTCPDSFYRRTICKHVEYAASAIGGAEPVEAGEVLPGVQEGEALAVEGGYAAGKSVAETLLGLGGVLVTNLASPPLWAGFDEEALERVVLEEDFYGAVAYYEEAGARWLLWDAMGRLGRVEVQRLLLLRRTALERRGLIVLLVPRIGRVYERYFSAFRPGRSRPRQPPSPGARSS